MRTFARPLTALATVLFLGAGSAHALDLTQRRIDIAGAVHVGAATKASNQLILLDSQAEAPIHLMITATAGSAQGVMLIADTIRSLRSPVVAVVVTQVHGAGAALAPFADRVLIYPSGGLVFTEVDYEGVAAPEPPPEPKPGEEVEEPEPPKPGEVLLQKAREAFLDRFYGRLAKRMYWKPETLRAHLDEGGVVVTPEEAVDQRIAHAVVDSIRYTQLPEIKIERKATVQKKSSETVPVGDEVPDEGEDEDYEEGSGSAHSP